MTALSWPGIASMSTFYFEFTANPIIYDGRLGRNLWRASNQSVSPQ